MSVEIYGTLGPACADAATLAQMIDAGMTGIRLNLSHMTLREAQPYLDAVRAAERESGRSIGLLLDMQGPELRVGRIREPMVLEEGARVVLGEGGIPLPEEALCAVTKGQVILLDDGKLRLRAESANCALVERRGVLRSRKSAALPGVDVWLPVMTAQDRENLALAPSCGVTAVMQPFVRSADDLKAVRAAMNECGGTDIRLFAKIENRRGMDALPELLPNADEIVIARGDLGNAMPLWELPRAQAKIVAKCTAAQREFMLSTQMLHSMHHSAVPTRAEVTDVYQAAKSGASYLLLTGETAVGEYPVEAMHYFAKIAHNGWEDADEMDRETKKSGIGRCP